MYDGDALELAYERYSTTLAEALGSSGAPEKIDWESWESALHGTGIYFDYYGDFQLSILAIWLGTEITGEAAGHSARRFCLSVEGDDVYLYYIRERGTYSAYRCETAVPASQLMSRLVECKPNGAEFKMCIRDSGCTVLVLRADQGQRVGRCINCCLHNVQRFHKMQTFLFSLSLRLTESGITDIIIIPDLNLQSSTQIIYIRYQRPYHPKTEVFQG